jgi:hypothetical protein
MSSAVAESKVKTYGGYHQPKGWGFWIFGPVGTILAVILSFIVILLVPSAGIVTAMIVAVVGAGVLILLVLKDRNQQSILDKVGARMGFAASRREGSNLFFSGTLTHFGSHKLPGVLSESTLEAWEDKNGQPFTILQYPKERLFVVNISADPDGSTLVDPEDLEAQVAKYGEWLADLAFESVYLMQAAVTIETTQDSGPGLTLELTNNTSPKASSLSKEWAAEVMENYPQGSTAVRAYVTLSFRAPKPETDEHGKKIKGQDPAQVIGRLIADRLPQLMDTLPETGAGTVVPMSTDDVIEAVRCAYNPEDRKAYDELASKGEPPPVTLWDSVGPSGGQAFWDYYQHSDAISMTWEVVGFISSRVISKVLRPVLEPSPDVAVSRLTFLYKPIDPAAAGTIAEHDHRTAESRMRNSKKPTARQDRQVTEADSARHHEAHGAALVNFAILLTATVKGKENIAKARAVVEHQGPAARLILRPMNGSQDSAFAQGIGPLGLVTSQHLNIPTALSEGI